MYAVEVLDGRFCYVHKNRYVDSLSDLALERASSLVLFRSEALLRGLPRLPAGELEQLLEWLANRSPLRSLGWNDVAPLCQLGRIRHLTLFRLLMTHADMRAVLASVDTEGLTKLSVRKIRCKCQDMGPGPGWDERMRGGCHEERLRDVDLVTDIVQRAPRLEVLETDLGLDVERLATSGAHRFLKALGLGRLAHSNSPVPRSALTGRELQMILLQMPALRELHCDAAQALGQLSPDCRVMLDRLECVQLVHNVDVPLTQVVPPPPTELLANFCPNVRELTIRVTSSRDLVPLRRLRNLRSLAIRHGGLGAQNFLDESILEAMGDLARDLRHLELPLQAHMRPEVLAEACPVLETLVARCIFRRRRNHVVDSVGLLSVLFTNLVDVQLYTLMEATALLPLCPRLGRLMITLSQLNTTDARELAELCLTHCPRLEQLTVQLFHSGCSHRAAVCLLQRMTRVRQVRVFCAPTAGVDTWEMD